MIRETLHATITAALEDIGAGGVAFVLEHPADPAHGDFSTNAALVAAKQVEHPPAGGPRKFAEALAASLEQHKPAGVERIEIAGPGFINFYLSKNFYISEIIRIADAGEQYGRNVLWAGKKVMVEYTDPNPFKVFHIGHLMTNVIGESLARLFEFAGAEVKRANYQGDVGLHVAKALWGVQRTMSAFPPKDASSAERTAYLGRAYTLGANAYEDDEQAKREIAELNKKIYDRSDEELNHLYDTGRQWSLEHFEEIYAALGTTFDFYFFESHTGPLGVELVREFLAKGVFEESDGAVIFPGEKHGLHTRVFLTSAGLPPYEAKDLALAKLKYDTYPYDQSIVVTASEQTPYWQVVKKAMSFVYPELAEKTTHVGHGMMRFAAGKMSSRKGNIITGESLIAESIVTAEEKIQSGEDFSKDERSQVAHAVGVGALKYIILRQTLGKDIIYDAEKSFSLEGDSGPYVQYAYVRTKSILQKVNIERPEGPIEITDVERLLIKFPEVVERACREYEPHHVVTYLTQLAAAFNAYYANRRIIGPDRYPPVLTKAVSLVLKNGLYLLGIEAPDRM